MFDTHQDKDQIIISCDSGVDSDNGYKRNDNGDNDENS